MKNILLSFVFFLLVNYSQATIRRVNNLGGTPYSTLQAAHDAASIGDTIHVEGSPNNYTSVSASKQLVWIGPGYFIGTGGNNNVGLQYNQNSATVANGIYAGPGSSGSIFIGLKLGSGGSSGADVGASNITFKRCYFNSSNINGNSITLACNTVNASSNFTATQCFIVGHIVNTTTATSLTDNYNISNNFVGGIIGLPNNFTGVNIRNNFLNNYAVVGFGIIKNNILNNSSGNYIMCSSLANVTNNMFMNQTNSNYVNINGNVFVTGSLGASNSVFINAATTTGDSWMQLKVGSPAIGAGEGGIDMGSFGGTNPYKLSGIPPVPTIYTFQTNSILGNSVPCVISTKSNN